MKFGEPWRKSLSRPRIYAARSAAGIVRGGMGRRKANQAAGAIGPALGPGRSGHSWDQARSLRSAPFLAGPEAHLPALEIYIFPGEAVDLADPGRPPPDRGQAISFITPGWGAFLVLAKCCPGSGSVTLGCSY